MSSIKETLSRRSFMKLSGAVAAIGASAGLAACSDDSSSSTDDSTSAAFKLGHIGPLTGSTAIYGLATQNGAQLAVDEINAAGGDIQFTLESQDDENDVERSVNAYHTLIDNDMQILIGTTTTTPCIAVSAETNADRIFQLTPSASSVEVIGGEEIGADEPRKDNVFQMCFTDPNQGTASADYIADQNLGTNIAIIYNNADAYSTGIYERFVARADELGLNVVAVSTFTDDSATDFSVQVGEARSAGADLVFLPIYYTPASQILIEANRQEYTPNFFGVDGMDGILAIENFDTSLAEGVMLLTPFNADSEDERTQAFVAAYEEAYGDTPNQFAADAYDCVYAIQAAIESAGLTYDQSAEEICEALIETFTSDDFTYDGLTGEGMTWSDTGEVSKEPRGMIIQDGAYVGLD